MNNDPTLCDSCGTVLDSASPGGLCPRCLMAGAMQPTEPSIGAVRQPPPSIDIVQAAFPQLEILEFIGQGGMGWVFKARQPKLNRFVALKLLPSSLAERDAAFAGRFEREGQLLARLHHPNIVAVHDSGAAGGFFYLVMEYVEGVNLRQAMLASRFTPAQALSIVPRICDALQFAHDEGVLHRDIKPENILLDAKGRVKLADFGIAKLIGSAAESAAGESAGAAPELTQSGATLGTPNYMAPEQRDTPADVDHRADIYSLGVVFYELLTGELPTGSFAPPSTISATDPRVDAIVRQALEKERTRRQSSAGEMRTQVETISAAGGASPASSERDAAPAAMPATKMGDRAPYVLFLLLYLGLVGAFIISSQWLPPRVASHFGAEGRANGWMSRPVYLVFTGALPALMALIFAGIARMIPSLSAKFICIPRKDYWLAPERREATALLIRNSLAWLLCLLTLFFAGLHALTVAANRIAPARLSMDGLLALVIAFLVSLMIWMASLLMRLAETDSDGRGGNAGSSGEPEGSGPQSNSVPSETIAPRFSRTAIWATLWILVLPTGLGFNTIATLYDAGLPAHSTMRWIIGIPGVALIVLGEIGILGTTLLGWVAVTQIRRSAGRLYGMWLAVFDGLLFPLLLFDGVFAWVVTGLARIFVEFNSNFSNLNNPQVHPPLTTRLANLFAQYHELAPLIAVLIVLAVDYLVIRAVWHAVNKPARLAGAAVSTFPCPHRSNRGPTLGRDGPPGRP